MIERSSPAVTIIAVCYEHARFVLECLESVRAQTLKQTQLVIMDDRSKDGSVDLIQDWIARREVDCTFMVHRTNQGICKTLNEAVAMARGEYIACISTDDLWLPERLERQVAQMNALPAHIGVLYSDAYMIDEFGRRLPKRFIEAHSGLKGLPEGDLFNVLINGNFIPGMTALIRRSVFDEVGSYDEELKAEDYDFWLRVARRFHFAASPYVSASYRIVGNSLVRSLRGNVDDELRILRKWSNDERVVGVVKRRLAYLVARKMCQIDHPERRASLLNMLRYDRGGHAIALFILSAGGTLKWSSFGKVFLRLQAVKASLNGL